MTHSDSSAVLQASAIPSNLGSPSQRVIGKCKPDAAIAGKKKETIFPSTQLRSIASLELLHAESKAVLVACSTDEGLEETPATKIIGTLKKMSDITGKDTFAHITAPNVRRLSDGKNEDLQARGLALAADVNKGLMDLENLASVAQGLLESRTVGTKS